MRLKEGKITSYLLQVVKRNIKEVLFKLLRPEEMKVELDRSRQAGRLL